jgi:DNA (cytosine-5)-methyltransferase 3A
MGADPIAINSSLVSAQNRYRLYWTNIPNVTQPDDQGIILRDILETNSDLVDPIDERMVTSDGKSYCLTARYDGAVAWNSIERKQRTMIAVDNNNFRKLTPVECERLQTFPDHFTEGVSKTQRYKALGNSWTVSVITHIFKNL